MKKSFSVVGDILVVIFCLSLVLLSVLHIAGRKNGSSSMLVIFSAGEKYIYPLDRDGVYEIKGKIGVSTISVKDGAASFLDSPCPNKTCVMSAPVSKNGEWAACLPNDVFIRIESDSDDFDAVAF